MALEIRQRPNFCSEPFRACRVHVYSRIKLHSLFCAYSYTQTETNFWEHALRETKKGAFWRLCHWNGLFGLNRLSCRFFSRLRYAPPDFYRVAV